MPPHPSTGTDPVDNLTHAFAGAALSRAGLERATPLATATLVLAANVPDVDVLGFARGDYFALAFRRGITHGLPALVLLPALVAAAVLAWDRWVRRRRRPDAPPARAGPVLALAYLGAATHPVLDWMNTYGMRWALPFDGRWSYGDALFIVDPWLWLVLGAAAALGGPHGRRRARGWSTLAVLLTALVLLAPLPLAAKAAWVVVAAALVGIATIDPPDNAAGRRRMAVVLTATGVLYVAGMAAASAAASAAVARAAAAEGLDVRAVMVAPLPGDPFTGEVVVTTSGGYVVGEHRWNDEPRVRLRLGDTVPFLAAAAGTEAEDARRAADAARGAPEAVHFLTWSRLPWISVEPDGGGWRVRLGDARYRSRDVGSLSGLTVVLDGTMRVVAVE